MTQATITVTHDAVLIKRRNGTRCHYIANLKPASIRRLFAVLEQCEQAGWPNRYIWKGTL